MSIRYRGFIINEEYAVVTGDSRVSVLATAGDNVTATDTVGIYSSIEEAKAAINGAMDGGRECCDTAEGEAHHVGCAHYGEGAP